MELADWRAIGLKCGLEVHQQLGTGKLFSRTPSMLRDDDPHFSVARRLRPAVSELGEQDRAALEAFGKNISFEYEGYDDSVSLVELDEEPPQPIDKGALETVLEIALMCKSTVLDEIFVMRKLVIDGSNTSGFQRTCLVATGGQIEAGKKKLGIQTTVIEEDAARPVKKEAGKVTYSLDRLGIPLIELATEPCIETPEEAVEAARAIGTMLRLTGKVKRGLGSIRQDLNISVSGGGRVEVKGVQELEAIGEFVKREAIRQMRLLEVKKELQARGLSSGSMKLETFEVTAIFGATQSQILKGAISRGEKITGMKLEKFKGLLGFELQPGRRLGTEFADHVKVKAGLRGLFHSDELPAYGITEEEKSKAASALGCNEMDAFVLVAATREKAQNAMDAVFSRAGQCLFGIPEETRGAIEGGNTEYLRLLPGPARMYPETDLGPIAIEEKRLAEIKRELPLSAGQREKIYAKWGLSQKHVQEMKTSNHARLFEECVDAGADARKAASFLLESLVEARRQGASIESLTEGDLKEIVFGITSGKIVKEILTELILEKSRNQRFSIGEILSGMGAKAAGGGEVHKVVEAIVTRNFGLVKAQGERAVGPLMGEAMKELKGKASGKEISEALLEEIRKAM